MPDQGITPEEKLLRIIESPSEKVKAMKPRLPTFPDLKLIFKSYQLKYAENFKNFLTLKAVNALLVFFAGGVTLFLVFDFWMGVPTLSRIQRLEEMAKKTDIGDVAIERMNPLAVYLQEITGRNIFALPPPPVQAAAPQAPVQASPATASILASYRVVGIIWSETPQAIIENTKEGKTYFVNRGGKINEIRVKDILKDRVVLSYDDQELELR